MFSAYHSSDSTCASVYDCEQVSAAHARRRGLAAGKTMKYENRSMNSPTRGATRTSPARPLGGMGKKQSGRGPKRKAPYTTRLPYAIQDELEIRDAAAMPASQQTRGPSRKDRRKEQRLMKKQHRMEHFRGGPVAAPAPAPAPVAARLSEPKAAKSQAGSRESAPASKPAKSSLKPPKQAHQPNAFERML